MAKKEKNTGLGRGLDSLIPKIEETEVEEGISLEDLLRESEDESKTFEELVEEVEEEFDGEDELQVLEKSADDPGWVWEIPNTELEKNPLCKPNYSIIQ